MIKTKVKKWNGPTHDWQLDVRVKVPGEGWRRCKRGFSGTEKQARKEAEQQGLRMLQEATLEGARQDAVADENEDEGETPKEVPTLAEFVDKFINESLRANKRKQTTIDTYEYRLKLYLTPALGHLPLDEINTAAVVAFKARKEIVKLKETTTNAILGVLSAALNFAVDCEVLDRSPLRFKKVKLRQPKREMPFYEDEQFEKLLAAARTLGPQHEVIVLLGGEAGLRRGEIAALGWGDVDQKRKQLTVRGTRYKGKTTSPKGNAERTVRMTSRLAEALKAVHHDKGPTVLVTADGEPFTECLVNELMLPITKAAGMKATRKVHILRHTFCSTLASRGAPAAAIQKLAGHTDLATTQRYMHLSPEEAARAIDLLEKRPEPTQNRGRIVEESVPANEN